MPSTELDGIRTRYEVAGSGPPLLMFSPGGFNATLENWRTHGIYRTTNILAHLRERFTCITFDRRESGESGGRVERVGWLDYARQGLGLLDHLGVDRAHLMGGCVGCSVAARFAVSFPDRTAKVVLFSPAGGVRYRMLQHARLARHLAYVREYGLAGVAELAGRTEAGFSADARVGPWVPVLRTDPAFAAGYVKFDQERYELIVDAMARLLFDRDTVPGAEPEDLLLLDAPALIVPGQDTSHAPSAARYLQECLPSAEYWDVPVAEQTEASAPARVITFLA